MQDAKIERKKFFRPDTKENEWIYTHATVGKVTASARGVESIGIHLQNRDELEEFAQLLSCAWNDHEELKKKVKLSLLT